MPYNFVIEKKRGKGGGMSNNNNFGHICIYAPNIGDYFGSAALSCRPDAYRISWTDENSGLLAAF